MDAASLSIDRELKLTNGGSSDISRGIAAAFKTNVAQVTTLLTKNIVMGTDGTGSWWQSNLGIRFCKYSNYENIQDDTTFTELMSLDLSGNLSVYGEVSGNVLNTGSDIRFKNRISDVVLDLDTMADAPMFRFTWKNRKDDRVYIGSSAQYWKETNARELVSRGCDDFHRLDYSTLGVLFGVSLAKKTKNHEDRIKELEMKVESLEQENRRLRYGN